MERIRNDNDYPLILQRKEAAALIGLSENYFADILGNRPDFPSVKVGTEKRYPRDEVIKWLALNWELLR